MIHFDTVLGENIVCFIYLIFPPIFFLLICLKDISLTWLVRAFHFFSLLSPNNALYTDSGLQRVAYTYTSTELSWTESVTSSFSVYTSH